MCVCVCVCFTAHPHKTIRKGNIALLIQSPAYCVLLIDSPVRPDHCAVQPVQATPPEDYCGPPVPGDRVQSGPHVLPTGVPATGVQRCDIRVRDGRDQEAQASGGSADRGEGQEVRGPSLDFDDALRTPANSIVASAADLS